jgi:hypothetical protein
MYKYQLLIYHPIQLMQLQEHMVHLGDRKFHLSGCRLPISRIPNRLQTQLHNANYPSMAAGFLQLYKICVPGDLDVADSLPDNSSKANADNGYTPSPGLSLAIYDPSLNLSYALNNGYTRMVDINASGMTSINLGLRVRRDIKSGRSIRL